jgi:hypothetical protein
MAVNKSAAFGAIAALAVLFGPATESGAVLFNATGSFSVSGAPSSVTPTALDGSFSFTFDADPLSTSNTFINNIVLTSFSLTPSTVGATTFDISTVGGTVSNSVTTSPTRLSISVGGLVVGAGGVSSLLDDFRIDYGRFNVTLSDVLAGDVTMVMAGAIISNAGDPGIRDFATRSGTVVVSKVSEPAALAVVCVGLAGAILARRRVARPAFRRRR